MTTSGANQTPLPARRNVNRWDETGAATRLLLTTGGHRLPYLSADAAPFAVWHQDTCRQLRVYGMLGVTSCGVWQFSV